MPFIIRAMPVVFEAVSCADDFPFTSAVPQGRWPMPARTRRLEACGPNAAMTTATYKAQRFPWGYVLHTSHAVAFVVTACRDGVTHVYLVEQWRPTDIASWEIPAGGASSLRNALEQELVPEVGIQLAEIERLRVFRPFAHEVCRAVHVDGGPKSVHVVHVHLRDGVPLREHRHVVEEEDERVRGFWITLSDLERCVAEGRIVDVVTLTALARCLDN